MDIQIIPMQSSIPTFDSQTVKVKHIAYDSICDGEYEEKQITNEIISNLLDQIPKGIHVYLSLIPYGEDDWLEVICDGNWLVLGFRSNGRCGNYYSYNVDFEGTEELTPLESGGNLQLKNTLPFKT